MSRKLQPRSSARRGPTVLLPEPMKPTSTTRRTAPLAATRGSPAEHGPELGEGDGRALRVLDLGLALRGKAGDGHRHRDAVVAEGANGSAPERRAALDHEAVRKLLDAAAERAQVQREGGDAVAFLDPQLARPGDRGRSLGAGGGDGEGGDLVDERGHDVPADRGAVEVGGPGEDPPHGLRLLAVEPGLDPR